MATGIKRVMAKAILFGVCYAGAYTGFAVAVWRAGREVSREN